MDSSSNFRMLRAGGERSSVYQAVIVDEASMLDITILATLLRALNLEYVDRLILVGDPGQLPPIGPGRPFLNLIEHLRRDGQQAAKHLAELRFNCRQAQGSQISTLAGHFARVEERPDEAVFDILTDATSKRDLAIHVYEDESKLSSLLRQVYEQELRRLCEMSGDL